MNYTKLTQQIKNKALDFGFLDAKIASIKIDLTTQSKFNQWLQQKFHGNMVYLEHNTNLRFNPEQLHNGTLSIICVKAPYLTNAAISHKNRLNNPNLAYISSYALGRDYHKVVKKQLTEYTAWITQLINTHNSEFIHTPRVFTDSAPILEVELAKNAGLGWRGKNTLLINKSAGSFFFLGEIFTNLPLVPDVASSNHCGSCTKCQTLCPTDAFTAPYVLNATKCISYLTIENKGSIPLKYRKAIGNRIYGCDDCQLVCPWNKFSHMTQNTEFKTRHNLDQLTLIEAFSWTEEEWVKKMQGSAIYRIGYISWLRNVAVALGNAPTSLAVVIALQNKLNHQSELVREHIIWALQQHSTS